MYCSKFVREVLLFAGVSIGKIQTFKELLNENKEHGIWFWRLWFFGFIPWARRTVTPASLLNDMSWKRVFSNVTE
jgi:hypothetical protein